MLDELIHSEETLRKIDEIIARVDPEENLKKILLHEMGDTAYLFSSAAWVIVKFARKNAKKKTII